MYVRPLYVYIVVKIHCYVWDDHEMGFHRANDCSNGIDCKWMFGHGSLLQQ